MSQQVWKGVFDVKHGRGTYYGRVAFVEAPGEASARDELRRVALEEFPNHSIEVWVVKPSTPAAAEAYQVAKERTAEWQRRNRERQVLLCKSCNGTGLA